MAKRKTKKTRKESIPKPKGDKIGTAPQDTKEEFMEFTGGTPINLNQKTERGRLGDILATDIVDVLDQELVHQEQFVKNIERWQRQFKGRKEDKASPYGGASNVHVPITRWLTETVLVRVIDAIFSQQKVWIVRPKSPENYDLSVQLEDALDWWQKDIADFRKAIFSPLLQCMKIGTGVVKVDYERKQRLVYRHASEKERGDNNKTKYITKAGNQLIKEPVTVYDGPVIIPVPREDWVISSDSTEIQGSFLCGFRTRLRKPQILARARSGYYTIEDEDLEKLTSDEIPAVKQARLKDSYKDRDESRDEGIEVWELWLRYDVDGDGEEDDIVVVFHKNSQVILKATYNPYFHGYRPFKNLVFNPVEFTFDGDGICSILEKMQNEIDTIHNQRIDRMNQINGPVYIRRTGSMPKTVTIHPGAMIDVDDIETSIRELAHHGDYPSTERLEQLVVHYMQQVIGVSPAVMGQSIAERPVARDTLALIQEANKKFKFGIDNLRKCIEEIGMMVLESFAQYSPTLVYSNEQGEAEKTLEFPFEYIRDGVNVKLMASSEVMNTESQREIDLTLWQLLTDYSVKMAGLAQQLLDPQVPPPFKKLLMEMASSAEKLMKRTLRGFQCVDEDLVVSVQQHIPLQQMMQPPGPQPPQGAMPGQGRPPAMPGGPQGGPPGVSPGMPGGMNVR